MTTPPGTAVGPAAPEPEIPANESVPQQVSGPARRWFRYTLPGAWVALAFVCLSFTPTLLPRPAFFQGFVCGINGAIGYGLGVVGGWLWREFADRPARPGRRRSWQLFGIVGVLAVVAAYSLGLRWQNQIRDLMTVPHEGIATQFLLPIVAALVFVTVIALSRCIRKLYRWVVARLSHWMGRSAARGLGWVLVAGAAVLLFSGVILDGAIGLLDRSFSLADTTTSPNAEQPTTALRSGGPDSLVPWDTLGFEGRNFAGQGPTGQQIAEFTGAAALPPIRAYAGIASAADVEARAALAVDDLERAGGFDRTYLLVAGTTGTGWVDPGAIDSLEYETGGDVASVAIQYSYLPSWLSFVVDQERAREAGRAIFEAVYQRWSDLPAETRPKLLLFGVSLGSFSGETAFSGEFDLRNRTDGVLFAGPPNFNTLFTEFRDRRDAGSREAEPVFRDGRTVRVTGDPSGPIEPADAAWDGTRVLYLAHASDPIVWWSTDLILGRPDWLTEPPGSDVIDEMVWIPLVTFWQVTADMIEPVAVPQGHGHSYTIQYVDGWAAVIQPAGWTSEKSDSLREIIMAEPAS